MSIEGESKINLARFLVDTAVAEGIASARGIDPVRPEGLDYVGQTSEGARAQTEQVIDKNLVQLPPSGPQNSQG